MSSSSVLDAELPVSAAVYTPAPYKRHPKTEKGLGTTQDAPLLTTVF